VTPTKLSRSGYQLKRNLNNLNSLKSCNPCNYWQERWNSDEKHMNSRNHGNLFQRNLLGY